MTLFEKLVKLYPEKYKVRDLLGVPYLFNWDGTRSYSSNNTDDLILIADELGAKIWCQWRGKDIGWGAFWELESGESEYVCNRDTQQAAYLAALESVVSEMEGKK